MLNKYETKKTYLVDINELYSDYKRIYKTADSYYTAKVIINDYLARLTKTNQFEIQFEDKKPDHPSLKESICVRLLDLDKTKVMIDLHEIDCVKCVG